MATQAKIEQLISLIFGTTRLIRERTQGSERIDPFSFLRLETLRYVAERDNPSMKKIADYLCVTPPSATSLIESLVKKGQLTRMFDKKDRRIVRLAITPKGTKTIEKGFSMLAKQMKQILDKLDDKEIDDLSSILEKLSRLYTS